MKCFDYLIYNKIEKKFFFCNTKGISDLIPIIRIILQLPMALASEKADIFIAGYRNSQKKKVFFALHNGLLSSANRKI